MKSLLSINYDEETFKEAPKECSICMEEYTTEALDSMVTPL